MNADTPRSTHAEVEPVAGRATPINRDLEDWRQSLRNAGFNAPKGLIFHPSRLLHPGGDRAAAKAACERFLALEPDQPEVLAVLAAILQAEGKSDQTLALRRRLISQRVAQWALHESAHEECVDYLCAAASGGQAPDRMPDAYVSALFDSYAENFDDHLVNRLAYGGPKLILDALTGCGALGVGGTAAQSRSKKMLDLGCGTGLVGSVLRPHVDWLEGVDLSTKMLDRARERGIYDSLERANLLDYLNADESRFQLIAAGEVLIYFGALEPVLRSVRARLDADGRFVFTLEKTDKQDYRLSTSGRYQHHHDYVIEAVERSGYVCEVFNDVELREHHDVMVPGYVLALRNAG